MVEHQFEGRGGGLGELPVGPALSAALHRRDPATVPAVELAELLAAARRQLSADTARFATIARELALADVTAPAQRGEVLDEFAADEVRAVLSISRTAAWALVGRAEDTARRLPELGAAWAEGRIDEDRVRTFCTWTDALSHDHARRVVEVVLPEAPFLTQRALITRIREVAIALDPEWARKLYENSVRQRRLRARMTEAGTANLSGLDLPLDTVARSVARITAMASRAKALGHPGLIDTIRADVYAALLSPECAGADDDAVVAAVLAGARPDDPIDPETPDPTDAPPEHPWPGEEPDADAGTAAEPLPPTPEPAPEVPSELAPEVPSELAPEVPPEPAPEVPPEPAPEVPPEPAPEVPSEPAPEVPSEPVPEVPFEAERMRRRKGPRQARIEVRVGLATLLGLDHRPARIPGWGVVHAELARQVARDQTGGEWRVAVTDGSGVLAAALITRHRPHGYRTTPHSDPALVARPVVELHTTEEFLDRLDPADHPAWARVIADLQHQLDLWRHVRDRIDPEDAEARRRALARFPSASLARLIEMRDRGCVFPSCGASALACDLDHTRAVVAEGGLTADSNLAPLCRHDHDLKHHAGWRLQQPRPGVFTWTSPTGRTYDIPARSALPDLPAPRHPGPGQRSTTHPTGYAGRGPVWDNDPYPVSPPAERPPPRPEPGDDPPPF